MGNQCLVVDGLAHLIVEILQYIVIYKVPVPNMNTLRKMHIFHPHVYVIGLQKCMTTISELLTKKLATL